MRTAKGGGVRLAKGRTAWRERERERASEPERVHTCVCVCGLGNPTSSSHPTRVSKRSNLRSGCLNRGCLRRNPFHEPSIPCNFLIGTNHREDRDQPSSLSLSASFSLSSSTSFPRLDCYARLMAVMALRSVPIYFSYRHAVYSAKRLFALGRRLFDAPATPLFT